MQLRKFARQKFRMIWFWAPGRDEVSYEWCTLNEQRGNFQKLKYHGLKYILFSTLMIKVDTYTVLLINKDG